MSKFLEKIRVFLKSDQGTALILGCIVILVGTGAYALGKLSEKGKSCVEIYGTKTSVTKNDTQAKTSPKDLQTASVTRTSKKIDTRIVASKTGTQYYYTWCAGANRIKEENRVYFDSAKEAEVRGLTLAKNCN